MKTFIFLPDYSNKKNHKTAVYQIKKNKPIFLGCAEYQPGATYGEKHEVVLFLTENKYLPKNCFLPGIGINREKKHTYNIHSL